MSRSSNCLVTLSEVATEAGWNIEGALAELRIEVQLDWAGRACVSPADAAKLMLAARGQGDAWLTEQNQRLEKERAALRAAPVRRLGFLVARSMGPAGGVRSEQLPGE